MAAFFLFLKSRKGNCLVLLHKGRKRDSQSARGVKSHLRAHLKCIWGRALLWLDREKGSVFCSPPVTLHQTQQAGKINFKVSSLAYRIPKIWRTSCVHCTSCTIANNNFAVWTWNFNFWCNEIQLSSQENHWFSTSYNKKIDCHCKLNIKSQNPQGFFLKYTYILSILFKHSVSPFNLLQHKRIVMKII